MRSKLINLTIIISLAFLAGNSCSTGKTYADKASVAGDIATNRGDPEIQSALKFIEKMPESPLGYNNLAILYIKNARQTGDFALNAKAESAVKQALEISPGDLTSRKLEASLNLTFHRFQKALELGKRLQKENPSDPFVYGVLTDANVELGNYEEAIADAQKMVDLKPNSSSYARVGRIRSLHGDSNGAVEMLKLAARTADPADKEAQSWCLVQLGDEFWKNGKYSEAEQVYDEALRIFPDYYLALAAKGRVLASKNDFSAAEKTLGDLQNRLPHVESIILLADIYKKTGNAEKAAQQAELVEVVENRLGLIGDQKRLALFWADRNIKLDQALLIAEREFSDRKDIFTADVYAWSLLRNGRAEDAKAVITQAMRLKTNDARIIYHAGMIENALGNRKGAKRLLELSLKINPAFDLLQAENARNTLEALR